MQNLFLNDRSRFWSEYLIFLSKRFQKYSFELGTFYSLYQNNRYFRTIKDFVEDMVTLAES